MFGTNNKGISKSDALKRNYFDILGRHLGHICGASFWFALTNLLFFGASLYLFVAYFGGENLVTVVTAFLNGKSFTLPIVPFLPLMLTGPFTAGFTYVIRNYAKQEHAFLISDFFEHSKKNWKQALITSILSYFVLYLFLQAVIVYNSMFINAGLPLGVLYALLAIVAILLIIMSFYIYPLMVTFRMKYTVILKNAWTFTILKLPQNFLIFALLAVIHGALLYLIVGMLLLPELWFILMALFLTGFTSYTANFYIWHVMEKHIVAFVTPKENEASIFTDEEHIDNMNMEDNDDDNL